MIAKHQTGRTEIVHMPLNCSPADAKNLRDAVNRHPRFAGAVVTMIQDAKKSRKHMKPEPGLAKLRDKVFGFGYAVKFGSPRHIHPFRVCGGSPWVVSLPIAAASLRKD
jgi:hypothetical protein